MVLAGFFKIGFVVDWFFERLTLDLTVFQRLSGLGQQQELSSHDQFT